MSEPMNPIAALIAGVDQIIAMNSPELVPAPGSDVSDMIGRWKELDPDERSWTTASLACANVMLLRVQVGMLGELVQAVRAGNGIATAGFGGLGEAMLTLAGAAETAAPDEGPVQPREGAAAGAEHGAPQVAPGGPVEASPPEARVIPLPVGSKPTGGRSGRSGHGKNTEDKKEDQP